MGAGGAALVAAQSSGRDKRGRSQLVIGNIGIGNISTLATFTTFDCRAMPNPHRDELLRGAF